MPRLRTLKQVHGHIPHPHGEGQQSPAQRHEQEPSGRGFSSPHQAYNECRHSQHPDLTFTTDLSTEPPDKASSNLSKRFI